MSTAAPCLARPVALGLIVSALAALILGCPEGAPAPASSTDGIGAGPSATTAGHDGASLAPPPSTGGDAAPSPQTSPPPPAAPAAVDAGVAAVEPEASTYPAVSRGRPIRLRSTLESDTRDVDGRQLPTVAHPDSGVRAALDEGLAALHGRCRVVLALERLVSVSCSTSDGMGRGLVQGEVFTIEGGAVSRVDQLTFFHAGADRFPLLRRLQYDPAGGVIPFVLSETGLELRFDGRGVARFPWRTLAPLLRPDTALGEALAAEGVPLAPAGVPFPPEPPRTIGLWADSPAELVDIWSRLPEALRPGARLVTPGGQRPAALVFPPGTDGAALSGVTGADVRPAYFVEPMAELVPARATESLEVRERPGPRANLWWRRPQGTLVTLVRGLVERTDSDVGRPSWAYVRVAGSAGWTRGRSLELATTGCSELSPPDDAGPVVDRGVLESAGDHHAWFLEGTVGTGGRQTLALHALAGCTVGTSSRRYELGGRARQIHFVPIEPEAGRTLIVVWVAGDTGSRLVVYDLGREAPLLEVSERIEQLDVPVDRGPDRARGYFPIRVRTARGNTWYRWTGTALEAVTP